MRRFQLSILSLSLFTCAPWAAADDAEDFNTSFIHGQFDNGAVKQALSEGINQSVIYDVQVNGQAMGSFYFNRHKNLLTFNDEFLKDLSERLQPTLIEELNQAMALDSTSERYQITEQPEKSQLSLWFNDEDVRHAYADSAMPLTASMNALLMNYSMSANYFRDRRSGTSDASLPFNDHIQLGLLEFPINVDLSSSDLIEEGVNVDNLSVSHLLPSIKSEATVGQTYSQSRYGEGFSFMGAQLNSVDDLLSRRERLYTPSITGFARTNATVEVYQDKRLLYTKTVAAGNFVIDEVQGLSNQTLRVVVKEADGSQSTFFYENTVVPGLLTPGVYSYQANTGVYRYDNNSTGDYFTSGEYSYGFGWGTPTVNAIVSENYNNLTVGVAFPLQALGALGFAAANSQFKYKDRDDTGQSYSISYAKYMQNGVNIQLAGYRYSTRDYYTFREAMEYERDPDQSHNSVRNRITTTIIAQEPLFDNQVSFSYMRDRYWANIAAQNTFSAYYGGNIGRVNYNISLSRSFREDMDPDTSIGLYFDIPIGDSGKSAYTRINHDSTGSLTEVGLSNFDQNSAYSLSAARASSSKENTLSGNYSHFNSRVSSQISGTVSTSSVYTSGSLSGSMAFADSHFIFSNSQSSTMGLAKIDGVHNATINGVKVQDNGYALIPLNETFDEQDVTVDTSSVDNNVMLEKAQIRLRPRRGSVTAISFNAQRVKFVRLSLMAADGTPVGFGARIVSSDGHEYYAGHQGGFLLQLMLPDSVEFEDLALQNPESGCRYVLPASVIQSKRDDDFINAGTLKCLNK